MTTNTPCADAHASRFYIRALKAAAVLLAGASLCFAAVYGFTRGTDLPSSLAWAAVGIAAGLVALVLPRTMLALGRDFPRLAMAALLYIACVLWMLAGALGSAAGGRQHAAAVEMHTTDAATRAQADYDRSTAALKSLRTVRPADTIEADIDALDMAGVDCGTGRFPTKCNRLANLEAEHANAVEAARLHGEVKAASAKLDAVKPAPAANADAAAIARYLAAAGIVVTTDRVTDALTLLAVLVVEIGPGLALALAASPAVVVAPRASTTESVSAASNTVPLNASTSVQADAAESVQHPDFIQLAGAERVRRKPRTLPQITVDDAAKRLLTLVERQGGELFGGQRAIARALNMSLGATNELLSAVALSGKATVEATTRGTRIKLAA